eukprot:scaffold283128_cov33-Tisochrysis_lutea.AAC.2
MRAAAQAAREAANADSAREREVLEAERLRTKSALSELQVVREQLEGAIGEAERARDRATELQRLLKREEEARQSSDMAAQHLTARLAAVKEEVRQIPTLRAQLGHAESEKEVAKAEVTLRDKDIQDLKEDVARATSELDTLRRELEAEEPNVPIAEEDEENGLQGEERASVREQDSADLLELERARADVVRLEAAATRAVEEFEAAQREHQNTLAIVSEERDEASRTAGFLREEIKSLKIIIGTRDTSLEEAQTQMDDLSDARMKMVEEISELKLELTELRSANTQLKAERDRALEGKKKAEERYDAQEASMRYLQGKVDGYQAELRDEVGKVQRKLDALNMDLKAKDIMVMATENELELSKCTIQELESQVEKIKAEVAAYSEKEAAVVADYEERLKHQRRLTASTQEAEQMTERKYKALAAEQHGLQKEVLTILSNLSFVGLRGDVMKMVHAIQEQAANISELTPFRDSAFEVEMASATLSDVVDPLQESRDAAFEMYMLELDQSRAFHYADDYLRELCGAVGALASHADEQLAPLADTASDAMQALPRIRARVTTLESELASSRMEATELKEHITMLKQKHQLELKETEEKAVVGAAELRQKHRAQMKQLLALKEKLDDAEYELSQWEVGAIRNSNVSQWRKTQELKKAKERGLLPTAPLSSSLSMLGGGRRYSGVAPSELSEDSEFLESALEEEFDGGGPRQRTSLVRDANSIAAATRANAERKRKQAKARESLAASDALMRGALHSSAALWKRDSGSEASSRRTISPTSSRRSISPTPDRDSEKPTAGANDHMGTGAGGYHMPRAELVSCKQSTVVDDSTSSVREATHSQTCNDGSKDTSSAMAAGSQAEAN